MSTSLGPLPLPRPTEDETLSAFDSVPLFMKSIPDEGTEDIALAALQSLVYEGPPDEVAQNFKEQGNEYFKGKRYREAIGFYTQGVDAKPTDKGILEALLLNRAACNLELQNYGSVLRDCSKVLSSNFTSSKAFYRSGQALLRLGRLNEAMDCCERCLSYDTTNDGMLALKEKVLKLKEEADLKAKKKLEQLQKDQRAKVALQMAYRERNLVIYNKPGGSTSPVVPHFDTEDPTGATLIFPVFFLYPQHATSDIISNFNEDTAFVAHLETMFPPQAPPPDWDTKGEYITNQLVVYATTHRKRILKVGKKMTLRDVVKAAKEKEGQERDGLELKDNCLSFVVMPKGAIETKWNSKHNAPGADDGWRKWPFKMSTVNNKILRTANAPTTAPDETEKNVAQALIDLENSVPELKSELRALQISAAREVDVRGGKKAIVIFVPVPQLKAFHKIQQRLTRELEKKFSERHVVFIAQRRMLRKPTRNSRVKQKRPRSRTLTSVHEKILEDLVFPTEIVGKRTRVSVDGSKLLKVLLDAKDATSLEYKLDSFSSVYRRLTGKDVVFEFPVVSQE
ncbi:40S ribosomal protein S7 [Crepidotus variabilis]|uniref:40S ribosomal protein S7 n=1 Tax=Crepidotus variabilis TaxID=179855 RepID=A0A9P6JVZ5_9AGAR|nr:40S ribosomal protein S7 [Crepidotus variabilis]